MEEEEEEARPRLKAGVTTGFPASLRARKEEEEEEEETLPNPSRKREGLEKEGQSFRIALISWSLSMSERPSMPISFASS